MLRRTATDRAASQCHRVGHLLVDYYSSGSSGPRYWSSFTLGSTQSEAAGGWPMQGGDYQHRNSLKTQ